MVITNYTKISIRNTRTNRVTHLLDTNWGESRKTGNVVAGIPFIDTVDNSLDSFVVQIKDIGQRELFKPFDFVFFTVNDGVETIKKYFVLFDNVQTYSQSRGTYVHNLTLIEPTKILEKIKIFNLNLTNQNDTLYNQIYKAVRNAEPVFYNYDKNSDSQSYKKAPRISFSTSFYSLVKDKQSRDFYFSNTDLRTVLDEMLSAQNVRVTVEDVGYDTSVGDINEIKLGYRDLTQIAKQTPIWTEEEQGRIVFENAENDGQNYAGGILARGFNSITEETIEFTDIFKSGNAAVTDNNACVFFPFPISEKGIKSFYIKNVPVTYYRKADFSENYNTFMNIDIASRIIPAQQYELLSSEDQRAYIPYNIGSNVVEFGKRFSKWYGEQVISVISAIVKCIPNIIIDGVECNPVNMEKIEYYNHPIECSYYPIIDTVATIAKPNTYDKDDLLMSVVDSQTEQTLDIDLHGKKLSGLIKRTGNAEYYLDVKAKYYSRLLPLMSKIDLPDADGEEEKGYVLYKREYSIYDNFINCRYYFSKDFNAVQQNAGVNREKHLYDIPLESSETPIVVKKYLVFSKYQGSGGGFESSLSISALNTLIGVNISKTYPIPGTEETKTAGGKLKYLLFKSFGEDTVYPQGTENSSDKFPYKDNDAYYFVRPICCYALNKTMTFTANCFDNYSVDYSRDGYTFSIWGDAGNKITYNRYVDKTTKTIGEANKFELDFAFEWKHEYKENFIFKNKEDSEAAKKAIDNMKASITTFPVAKNTDFVTCGFPNVTVEYYKDRTQTPLFVFALECVPSKSNYGDIIIGTEFAKNNNLVRDNGEGLQGLKLYTFDDIMFTGNENALPKMSEPKNVNEYFNVEGYLYGGGIGALLKRIKTFTCKSWSIADENGNIYIAVNGSLCDIYASIANFPY